MLTIKPPFVRIAELICLIRGEIEMQPIPVRPIDANALIQVLNKQFYMKGSSPFTVMGIVYYNTIKMLEEAPTLEMPIELGLHSDSQTKRTGEWLCLGETEKHEKHYACSECSAEFKTIVELDVKFCPKCGAKMQTTDEINKEGVQ